MAQIIQCLGGKTGGFDQITNKDAIILYSLANGINIDYASIFWKDIIIKLNKRHREKVVPYTRFLSLLMIHKIKEGYGDGEVIHSEPVVFKAPKPSSNAERVPQSTKPGAKSGHKKHSTSSKQPSVSSKEATKDGSFKAPTGSKTGHLKRKKESSSAMDSNLSQTSASTPVVAEMHKEDQQVTGGPTSLGVTSEARANPQISSRNDASAVSTTEADPGKYTPSDFVPQQQGMNEGTKNTSYDHLFAGTDPHVLADQTKSVSDGLEIFLTQPRIGKGASSIARQVDEEEASNTIKLEDLAKLVSNVQPSFEDLDSPEDDYVIVVNDSDEDEVHTTTNAETEDTSVLKSSSPSIIELEKNKAEAEAALLKAQPSFPNDLPSKFNEPTEELKRLKKQVHELEIELPGDLKEIPTKLEDFTKTITSLTSQVAELKTLQ
ncbi:hypothetical protein Tco_1442988 [Tanacetum coccineum]